MLHNSLNFILNAFNPFNWARAVKLLASSIARFFMRSAPQTPEQPLHSNRRSVLETAQAIIDNDPRFGTTRFARATTARNFLRAATGLFGFAALVFGLKNPSATSVSVVTASVVTATALATAANAIEPAENKKKSRLTWVFGSNNSVFSSKTAEPVKPAAPISGKATAPMPLNSLNNNEIKMACGLYP